MRALRKQIQIGISYRHTPQLGLGGRSNTGDDQIDRQLGLRPGSCGVVPRFIDYPSARQTPNQPHSLDGENALGLTIGHHGPAAASDAERFGQNLILNP